MNQFRLLLLLTTAQLTACASVERGTLLGAAAGIGGGAMIASAQPNQQGRATATVAGVLIGGALGYLFTANKLKQGQPKRLESPQLNFTPKVRRPEVRKVWVPDQISGDEYISGHWKFIIDRPATWAKED